MHAPEFMNLGNLLDLGEWAYGDRRRRRIVLDSSATGKLAMFPAYYRAVGMGEQDVRRVDRRVRPWVDAPAPQRWFDPPHLGDFIREALLPGSPVASRPADLHEGDLVVNVRRGDYFSVPEFRAMFGMDTRAYTTTAVARALEAEPGVRRLVVVSDDADWCRAHLVEDLQAFGPVHVRAGGVVDDLSALVHAPNLVVPNSTFSFWGGYIGDELRPGRVVVAPRFFRRDAESWRAHLKPTWNVIETIPGGWTPTGP